MKSKKTKQDGLTKKRRETTARRKYEVSKTMQVNVLSMKDNIHTFYDVEMIRLIGKQSNLLIMCDYVPMIGEFSGRIEIVTEETTGSFDDVDGYFCLKDNDFTFLMREDHGA